MNSMDEGLLRVLRAYNPWLDEPGRQTEFLRDRLPDRFVPRASSLTLEPGRGTLVVGPRQAGKSTWILESLTRSREPVLILNCEEPRIRELGASPATALTTLEPVLAADTVLVLEEVQHLAESALFLKGLVDLAPRRRIVATGSSSFALHARTRESLAGRVQRVRLLPFGLVEALSGLDDRRPPAVVEADRLGRWQRLLEIGGYPEPWLSPEPEALLRLLAESIVLRDASDLHTLERPDAFRRLLELAAADIGNLVNLSNWAALAGVSSATSLRLLEIAQDAHLLTWFRRYAADGRPRSPARPRCTSSTRACATRSSAASTRSKPAPTVVRAIGERRLSPS